MNYIKNKWKDSTLRSSRRQKIEAQEDITTLIDTEVAGCTQRGAL